MFIRLEVLTTGVLFVAFQVEPEIFNPLFLRFVPELSHFSRGTFHREHHCITTIKNVTNRRLDETRDRGRKRLQQSPTVRVRCTRRRLYDIITLLGSSCCTSECVALLAAIDGEEEEEEEAEGRRVVRKIKILDNREKKKK